MKLFNHIFPRRRNQIALSIVLICIITFISFSSSLENGFTSWDDQVNVTENLLIRDLSWNNIKDIFTSYTDYYRPLVFITYALEYSLFELEPSAYHTTNLLLHILNTLLVFWLILMLSNKISISLISALLFGVHPLHVESVAWVTERKDVLSTFFFLQATNYYLFYKKRSKEFYYYLSLVAFVLALLSKPMVVTLPLVLLLCDYLLYREFNRKNLLEKLPFFILSLIIGIVTLFNLSPDSSEKLPAYYDNLDSILLACWGIIFYLYKTIAPFSLSALYPPPEVVNIMSPEYFLPPVLLIVLTIALFYSRRWTRKVVFGSLFFLITILPVLQVVHVGSAAVADRYMYVPSIGLLYMVSVAFNWVYTQEGVFEKVRRVSLVLFLGIVILTFSVLSYQKNKVWEDDITLWSDVLHKFPDSMIAHYNLGRTYQRMGMFDNAISAYRNALRLNPPWVDARNNLGTVLGQKDKYAEAIDEFKEVLQIDHGNIEARSNMVLAYIYLGDCEKAEVEATSLLMFDPKNKIGPLLSEKCN